ncbi:MAG: ribonuclease D [Alphaproteobacteria bacterium]|nr:ribonuclease D [Alphaproteobacteria bacterium]
MLIQTTADLVAFCAQVADAPYLAVDTEFLREKTYFAKLCLVQVAFGEHAAAIDPLADDIDLQPLWDLLADPRIIKVLHAADQDLEILLQHMGTLPRPVFDTQIAATVCDMGEQPGYARLVSSIVGIELDKSSQVTDWSRRPLTDKQLAYALADVTHLCVVYETLEQRLKRTKRLAWVAEDMAALADESRFRNDPREAWKRVKMRRTKRRILAVLRELAAFRESEAQKRDLPRGWLVKDEALVEIAMNLPRSVDDLKHVRKLSEKQATGSIGKGLLAAVEAGLAVPDDECPTQKARRRRVEGNENLVALLQALLKLRCDKYGVAQSMVATRKHLDELSVDDEPEIPCMSGWRYKLFGKDALALMRGELALTGNADGDVELVELEPE